MSGHAHAIRLPKARRKRRKPPRPMFWWALFWLSWSAFWIVWEIAIEPTLNEFKWWDAMHIGMQGCLLTIWWPAFLREWKLWKKENDED